MQKIPPVASEPESLMPQAQQRAKLRRIRKLKDRLSHWGVATAGIAVVGALGLIFFYLFAEVMPLLKGAKVTPLTQYSTQVTGVTSPTVYQTLERYEQIGANYSESGQVQFFQVASGEPLLNVQLPVPADANFSALGYGTPADALIVYGYSNGQIVVAQHVYNLSYPNDQRKITPELKYPLGAAPITLDQQNQSLTAVAIQKTAQGYALVAATADNRLLLGRYTTQTNIMTGETSIRSQVHPLPALPNGATPRFVQVDAGASHVIVADDQAQLHLYDISNPQQISLTETIPTERGQTTALQFLVATGSVVVGTGSGSVSQWLLVRDNQNIYHLQRVREFESLPAAVTTIAPEYTRRGFLVGDSSGHLGIYYGTSARTLLVKKVAEKGIAQLAISPINGRLIITDTGNHIQVVDVWNQHPEISFSSLWQKVWYEGRSQPEYIWQASSGGDTFEAKMSLIPLSVGTLKAAFFAMLFAMPLGVMGALYTAYFMTPKLRGVVKPSIEIMEALPTVILGFLAGLWLAPFLESHLPAIFSLLLFIPLIMLVVGFLWFLLPSSVRSFAPEGWEAAILVLPIILTGWLCVSLSPHIEVWFFDGSLRQWFTNHGITYDQRNALVVGIAMGFAVIPTIFSIAEDAVFNVPRHLTQGSLALGATRWQTVIGVVLPTASPGIFSAVMMGFGRAVGETMIVLMATGNSPLVNFNIFEGMRTLSANIAVELPETAVASSHFRVLFLAALVLLTLTFIVNTCAEVIRQRLRKRYSNL